MKTIAGKNVRREDLDRAIFTYRLTGKKNFYNSNHFINHHFNYFIMKPELKKLIVFGIIITIFTTAYATFLSTVTQQGFLTDDFLVNWVSLIPETYLVFLPFVLITGRLTSALVERIFRNAK